MSCGVPEPQCVYVDIGMEAYRAKLRLLSLDVTICARAGHLTVFEKDNQQEEDAWRRKGPGKSLSSDEGKGELLRVPLPEFDVAGNATLVLALGGLQGHTVEWVAHDKALINKVPVDLPDSIVACMFRMPRDVFTESATETESLLFSPSILDFITDIQSLHRKHLKTFKHNLGASSTEQQPPSKQTDQHQLDAYPQQSGPAVLVPWTSPTGDGEIRTAAHAYTLPTLRRSGAESLVKNAAFSVDTVSGRGANEEINQSGPCQSSTVLGNHGKDREEVFCDPVASADGNSGVAESKRDAAGLAGQGNMADLAAANKARAVPSGMVLMSDVVYSMKFAALDLKLSGTENGTLLFPAERANLMYVFFALSLSAVCGVSQESAGGQLPSGTRTPNPRGKRCWHSCRCNSCMSRPSSATICNSECRLSLSQSLG